MNCMLVNLGKRAENIGIDFLISLYDTHVGQILNYGAEIWGWQDATPVENVHKKFSKGFYPSTFL